MVPNDQTHFVTCCSVLYCTISNSGKIRILIFEYCLLYFIFLSLKINIAAVSIYNPYPLFNKFREAPWRISKEGTERNGRSVSAVLESVIIFTEIMKMKLLS